MFSPSALTILLWGGMRASLRAPGQLLFTLVGIALASALVVGVDLANNAARAGYEHSFARLNQGVTHSVQAVDGQLRDIDYLQLRARWRAGVLPSLQAMAPIVLGSLQLRPLAPSANALPTPAPAADEQSVTRELWGIDPLQSVGVRAAANTRVDGVRLLTEAAIFVDGLAPGRWQARRAPSRYTSDTSSWQPVEVLSVSRPLQAAPTTDDASPTTNFDGIALADIATAQELLQLQGRLTRIDLRLACAAANDEAIRGGAARAWFDRLFPGLVPAPASAECATALVLPANLRLNAVASQRDEDLSAAAAFNFNLGALSLLAAAVAAFLVHQVVVLGAHRQTVEYGRLRALGMLGSEIALRLVLGYVLLAAFAGAIGVLLGALLARALIDQVSAVVNDLFFRVSVTSVDLDLVSAGKGIAVAVGVALLASIAPAWRLAHTAPVDLLHGTIAARASAGSPRFGLACLGLIPLLLLATTATWAALLAIGLALLAAVSLAPRLLPRPRGAAALPVVARLAFADLERTGRDAGLALGALIVAVATAFGIAWMIASFRGALEEVLDARLHADLLVRVDASASAQLLALARLPGLTDFASAGRDALQLGHLRSALRVVDQPAAEALRIRLPASALAAGRVVISEPLAHRLGAAGAVGTRLSIGRCRLQIGGVFKEYGSVQGRLVATRSVLQPCLALPPSTEAELSGRVSAAQVRAELGGARDLLVVPQAQVRAVSLAIFDRTFAVTAVVRWLALLVAAIALFASLSIWLRGRAAELGMLRALGLTGAELGWLLALQTLVLGCMAILLALPLGAAIAWLLTAELHPRAFGWSFPLHLDVATIAPTLLAAGVAVLAGAVLPVLSLLRTAPVHWLAQARYG